MACGVCLFQVLMVCEEEEIASYIYQISLHTLMNSERDGLSWLDRDWLSVQPTKVNDRSKMFIAHKNCPIYYYFSLFHQNDDFLSLIISVPKISVLRL